MSPPVLSAPQIDQYQKDGYLLISGFFSPDEIELLHRTAKSDRELGAHTFGKSDGEGGAIRLSVWNHPGNDIYGMFARSRRIVDAAEQLLGDEPYHYHTKLVMKDAGVGGAWTWHQDYGYWYSNGLLGPNLVSCFIAIDPATKENGCLQIIPGSHSLGRIDHSRSGDQTAADPDRVREILKRFPLVHIEMQPGDAVLFHANLLHRSDPNHSQKPRWSMICCYNAKSNTPYKESHHADYTPLVRVDDAAILKMGAKGFSEEHTDVAWLQDAPNQGDRTLPSK